MNQVILIKTLATGTAIMLCIALLAYLDTYRLFLFYKRQYEKLPRVNKRPEPSKITRIVSFILWLPVK